MESDECEWEGRDGDERLLEIIKFKIRNMNKINI